MRCKAQCIICTISHAFPSLLHSNVATFHFKLCYSDFVCSLVASYRRYIENAFSELYFQGILIPQREQSENIGDYCIDIITGDFR